MQSSTHARPADNLVLGGWLSFSLMGKRVTSSRETEVLQHDALSLSFAVKEGEFIRGAIFPATDKNLTDRIPNTCSRKILTASHNPTILARQNRREFFLSHSVINSCLEIIGQSVTDENLVLQNRRHFFLALPEAHPSLEVVCLDAANEGSEVCNALVGGHVLVVAGPGEHNGRGGERSRSRKS